MGQEDGKQASSFDGKETRGSVVLSVAFFAAFTAYMAIQNLQSSLNQAADLGIISLSVLYACIIFSGILAPAVIKFLGVKKSLILSWICHILYTGSNFYPTFYTLIPSSILLGAISGFMWTGQSIYISVCAFSLAKSTDKTEYDVLSKLNGLFFTLFETTQITGNLVSSLVLQTGTYSNVTGGAVCGPEYCPLSVNGSEIATPETSVVYILLGIYLGCDVIALVVTVFFLPPLPKSNWSSNASLKQSLSSFFVTLFKSKLIFLVPFIMFQAVEQAILWGDYTRSYVSCTIGIHMVGFIMATYGAATASCAFVFSRIAKYIGRYILFFTAAVLQGGVFVVLYIWTPTSEDTTYLFLIPVAWGLGEGIWQTQSNSLIALLFPEKKEPAFANFHTWKAIGFTLTFILSNFLCLKTKLIFVMSLLVVGMTMYTGVEIYNRRSHGSDVTKSEIKMEDKKESKTSL
ncbi:protein unc-93 homolog A-like [Haliotis cracherodii]|uniref:protein unc-93 homolog A-like n=1 Tax=Haliotis rufescens TaxID=6454 RepID=UPI00201E8E51|nr:protein unc-93 homolog A-like [Haliotis rufescens]XP_048237325.1 protein unc-93 homolog A-like [Haliotis rufescens]XP_048237326.1 protein unc-93 homolog A-like [Haliotis rufescens]